MEARFSERQLAPGVTLYLWPTRQFKSITVKVFLHHPLGPDATQTALLPRVLLRGSARYPTLQSLSRRREELYGTGIDGDVSKIGRDHLMGLEVGGASAQFVNAEPDLLDKQVEFLSEILFHPRLEDNKFHGDYLAQEKNVLRQKIEGLINDKRSYAAFRLYQEMCKGDPFATHRLGTLEQIDPITPEGLVEHYRRLLEQSPVSIFAVGAFDPSQVEEAVRRFPWPTGERRPLPKAGPFAAPERSAPQTVKEEQEVNQALLYLGYRTGITFGDPLYPALVVYNGILGAFPHSKLFIQVRERASLAYFAWTRLESTMGLMTASCGIDPKHYGRALELMQAQVEAMARGEFTEEELAATRASLRTSLRSIYDSPGALIDRILLGVVNGRQWPPEEMIAAIEKVTRDQVVEVAKRVKLDTIYFLTRRGEAQG
ncbi:MAG: insulinase family protein [Limnochordales bacterium]|nr:insulinase family protein [Limnochordales bacterium]